MNLLKETKEILDRHQKSPADVVCISDGTYTTYWKNFEEIADFEYDNDYGGVEILERLIVVGIGFWLERHEYDGSEWWEYKSMPNHNLPVRLFRKKDLLEE